MRFKFDLQKIGNKYSPLVPIILKSEEDAVEYIALIDTGADFCVFHNFIAEILGINLNKIKQEISFRGVGKVNRSFKGKLAAVTIMVAQRGNNYKFDSYVIFSDDIPSDGYPLLGMNGFVNKFSEIIIKFKEKKIILEV